MTKTKVTKKEIHRALVAPIVALGRKQKKMESIDEIWAKEGKVRMFSAYGAGNIWVRVVYTESPGPFDDMCEITDPVNAAHRVVWTGKVKKISWTYDLDQDECEKLLASFRKNAKRARYTQRQELDWTEAYRS